MWHSNFFFDLLVIYTIFLVSFTVLRKEVTYRGIFYCFCLFLVIFVTYLTWIFNNIWLNQGVSEFFIKFNTFNWLSLEVSIFLRLDALSYLFTLLVAIIGLGTNLYILNYLKYEAQEDVFVLLINWFMFSMIVLVLANNLFTLFLGWESIGLSSFFLINFWSTRRGTVKSSFKAFFFNKVSDVFLFVFLVFVNYNLTLNELHLLNSKILLNLTAINQVSYTAIACLFICTLFKSAQLFGHLWLPDSMEAPVPASALIHSATLVSAGIYLLFRFTPLLTLNVFQGFALLIGSVTAAYGGIVSASQTDMKKLLAYSTVSHCGFLFVTVGVGIYSTAIIYLFLHGLFKALTFFCAGSFIRVAGSQDTRQMGALSRILPVDTIFLIICAFNLGGLPFSLGYLYKNVLLSSSLNVYMIYGCLSLCLLGMLTSIIYVFRLVYYSAFDMPKDFFVTLVYELQQKQCNVAKYWSFTTLVQIIAITLLLLFSLWIYVYFINYFVCSNLTITSMPIFFECNNLLLPANIFYKSIYEIFYSVYLIVAIVLVTIGWRYEYTFTFKLNFVTYVITFIFFITVYSSIF